MSRFYPFFDKEGFHADRFLNVAGAMLLISIIGGCSIGMYFRAQKEKRVDGLFADCIQDKPKYECEAMRVFWWRAQ